MPRVKRSKLFHVTPVVGHVESSAATIVAAEPPPSAPETPVAAPKPIEVPPTTKETVPKPEVEKAVVGTIEADHRVPNVGKPRGPYKKKEPVALPAAGFAVYRRRG